MSFDFDHTHNINNNNKQDVRKKSNFLWKVINRGYVPFFFSNKYLNKYQHQRDIMSKKKKKKKAWLFILIFLNSSYSEWEEPTNKIN